MSHNISRLLDASNLFTPGAAVKQGAAANSIQAVSAVGDKPLGIYVSPESLTAAQTLASTLNGAVCVNGLCQALSGTGGVTAGGDVIIAADGSLVARALATWVITPTSGYVVGTALDSASAGEYFRMIVNIRKEPA